jgi:hypothetical protein
MNTAEKIKIYLRGPGFSLHGPDDTYRNGLFRNIEP